jgi:histidinol-phosphatase (PHP family)
MDMLDYHMHSSFSADSEMLMETACQTAIKKGLTEIAFTEHLDYFYPNCPLTFQFDYTAYAPSVEKMQARFGDKLTILKAAEIGLHESVVEKNQQFVQEHAFDFIIGSVHIADDKDMHNGDYFQGKTVDQALDIYFDTVYRAVCEHTYFHVLGHLDLIKRYVHYLDVKHDTIEWKKYYPVVEETLKVLIASGRGIEINMSGHRYHLGTSLPDGDVLRLYKTLGGEIITVGSDAHRPDHIAHHFKEAYQLLEETGFRYVTAFRQGEPRFIPIQELVKG